MAIVKHFSSKNNRYDDVLTYLEYIHERHSDKIRVWYSPVLDEYGLLQKRPDCLLTALDTLGQPIPPEDWASACERTNLRHKKTADKNRRKNHSYVISLPEEDRPYATKEELMDVARKMAQKFFAGYEVLIAVHFDERKNPHIHLVINSIRAEERPEASWMLRGVYNEVLPCEIMAGGMHQDSPGLRRALNDWMLEECRKRGWREKDNNAIADQRKKERFEHKNDYLRNAITTLAPQCQNLNILSRQLKDRYSIQLNRRGKTISLLHPKSRKPVRLTTLGLDAATLFQHMDDPFVQGITHEYQEQEKQYIDWVIIRRKRNEERARRLQAHVDELLRIKEKARNESYHKEDYRTLNKLVSHTSYLAAALATEKEKADRLLSAWDIYLDSSKPKKERLFHRKFVAWCGCNPDSTAEHQWLREQRESTALEEQMATELCNLLVAESDHWKQHDELAYLERNIAWLKRREHQLNHQIKYYKKRSRKLWEISCACEKAAMRYHPLSDNTLYSNGPSPGWENYYKFRSQWTEHKLRQNELEQQLWDIKAQRKTAQTQRLFTGVDYFFNR